MTRTLYATAEFTKIQLTKEEENWFEKTKRHLEARISGTPLRGIWLWEKRFRSNRLYFICHKDKVLFVAYGHKKEQQETIDLIVKNKDSFLDLLS